MDHFPFIRHLHFPEVLPDQYSHHICRNLSAMRGQFVDDIAFEKLLAQEDILLYEVYEFGRPEIEGELLSGLSIVHPGKIGKEYFMTKGHYHRVLETGEIYYCLKGQGRMVMETPEGDWDVKELLPGSILYVPPRWAHRSVNTGDAEDLITFFVYPAQAGHDYRTIEEQGFRKLILDNGTGPEIIDNPRWRSSST